MAEHKLKILISGATGFLGQAICQRLVEEGHELVVLTRRPAQTRAILGVPHSAVRWDSSSPQGIAADDPALQGVDSILHLAGEPVAPGRWTPERKKKIFGSRVEGTHNLWSSLKQVPGFSPKAIVAASAIGYYGDVGDQTLDESSPAGKDFLAEVCQGWEAATRSAPFPTARQAILRIGVVLGRGGGALPQLVPLFRNGVGGRLGSGRQWMSWIHLDDVVGMFVQALQDPAWSGVVNAVAPHPVTNLRLTESLAQVLGKPAIIPAPAWAMRLALGEMSQVVLGSQKVANTAARRLNYSYRYNMVGDALEQILGGVEAEGYDELHQRLWVPRPLPEIFDFFSRAESLGVLTPDFLDFKILGVSSDPVREGTLIDYRIKIHGVPARWRTRIENWNPPNRFADTQVRGPYESWHHTHSFYALAGGTVIEDRVLYRLPLAELGRVVAGGFVGSDVKKIFDYRTQVILKKFG